MRFNKSLYLSLTLFNNAVYLLFNSLVSSVEAAISELESDNDVENNLTHPVDL